MGWTEEKYNPEWRSLPEDQKRKKYFQSIVSEIEEKDQLRSWKAFNKHADSHRLTEKKQDAQILKDFYDKNIKPFTPMPMGQFKKDYFVSRNSKGEHAVMDRNYGPSLINAEARGETVNPYDIEKEISAHSQGERVPVREFQDLPKTQEGRQKKWKEEHGGVLNALVGGVADSGIFSAIGASTADKEDLLSREWEGQPWRYEPEGIAEKVAHGLGAIAGDTPIYSSTPAPVGFGVTSALTEYADKKRQAILEDRPMEWSDVGDIAIEGGKGALTGLALSGAGKINQKITAKLESTLAKKFVEKGVQFSLDKSKKYSKLASEWFGHRVTNVTALLAAGTALEAIHSQADKSRPEAGLPDAASLAESVLLDFIFLMKGKTGQGLKRMVDKDPGKSLKFVDDSKAIEQKAVEYLKKASSIKNEPNLTDYRETIVPEQKTERIKKRAYENNPDVRDRLDKVVSSIHDSLPHEVRQKVHIDKTILGDYIDAKASGFDRLPPKYKKIVEREISEKIKTEMEPTLSPAMMGAEEPYKKYNEIENIEMKKVVSAEDALIRGMTSKEYNKTIRKDPVKQLSRHLSRGWAERQEGLALAGEAKAGVPTRELLENKKQISEMARMKDVPRPEYFRKTTVEEAGAHGFSTKDFSSYKFQVNEIINNRASEYKLNKIGLLAKSAGIKDLSPAGLKRFSEDVAYSPIVRMIVGDPKMKKFGDPTKLVTELPKKTKVDLIKEDIVEEKGTIKPKDKKAFGVNEATVNWIKSVQTMEPGILKRNIKNPARELRRTNKYFDRWLESLDRMTLNESREARSQELARKIDRKEFKTKQQVKIGTWLASKDPDGLKTLKANRINIPKLTAKEQAMAEKLYGIELEMIDRVDAVRDATGYAPLKRIDNHFTLIRKFSLAEELGFNPMTVPKELIDNIVLDINPRGAAYVFGKERVESSSRAIELNAFDVHDRYIKASLKHVHVTPAIASMRDTLTVSGINKTNPVLYQYVTDRLNYVAGINADTGIPLLNKILRGTTRNVSMATIPFSTTSTLAQPAAMIPAIGRLGLGYFSKGVALNMNPAKRNHAMERSTHLFLSEVDINVAELRKGGYSFYKKAKGKIADIGTIPLRILDMETRMSTWLGAEAKALKKGMNPGEAVRYADNLVKDTQGSVARIDTAPIQTKPGGKAFTLFGTFQIGHWNTLINDIVGLTRRNGKITFGEFGEIGSKLDKFEAVKRMTRIALAGATVNAAYNLGGMEPPGAAPIDTAIEASKEDEAIVAWEVLKELSKEVPALSFVKYGSESSAGAVAKYGIELINYINAIGAPKNSMASRNAKPLAHLIAKGLGTPGTAEIWRRYKDKKRKDKLREKALLLSDPRKIRARMRRERNKLRRRK